MASNRAKERAMPGGALLDCDRAESGVSKARTESHRDRATASMFSDASSPITCEAGGSKERSLAVLRPVPQPKSVMQNGPDSGDEGPLGCSPCSAVTRSMKRGRSV